MYFEGKITIDPSSLTNIEKVKPTKAFKRMLYYMTAGGVSDKEERETFTAISILQQLNMVLYKNGIDDIVRLSHDDIDFYLDTEGKKNDLKEAFDKYELEINEAMSSHFNKIVMVLEHEDAFFKYLLEVSINRNHSVGAHPIEIKVSSFFKEFRLSGVDSQYLKSKLESSLSSQKKLDDYKVNRKEKFEAFISELKRSIQALMKIDAVESAISTKMVIPKTKVRSKKELEFNRQPNYYGIYYGYYGFDDYLFYNMLWSGVCHQNSLIIRDTDLESSDGTYMGYQLQADATDSLFDDSIDHSPTDTITTTADTSSSSDSSSWFDSVFDSDSFDSGSSCSSCSSCASCGGD